MSILYRQPMHLTDLDIASLLDGSLTQKRKQEYEAHLADCEACSEALSAAYRTMKNVRYSDAPTVDARSFKAAELLLQSGRSANTARGRFFRYAIAASLVIGLGLVSYIQLRQTEVSPFRTEPAAAVLEIVSPADNETVKSPNVHFRWNLVPQALEYRLSLYTDDGILLWKGVATVNELRNSGSVVFQSGNLYLWNIEAIFPDGTTLSSEFHAFRYAP